jgi:hypothetical protein
MYDVQKIQSTSFVSELTGRMAARGRLRFGVDSHSRLQRHGNANLKLVFYESPHSGILFCLTKDSISSDLA